MEPDIIQRTLFNPLKPYWAVYFVLLIVGIILLSFIPDIVQTVNFQQIILTSLFSIAISVIIFYIGINEKSRLQYADGLKKVIFEMRNNHSRIENFPKIFKEKCIIWEEKDVWKWIEKQPSYSNWGDGKNFHLKYLPTSAYFNFVNKGFILNQEYLLAPTEHIAHFYQFCIRFNNELQSIENQIRKISSAHSNPPIIISEPDCSGNFPQEENINPNGSFFIDIQYSGEKKEFQSKKELCNYVKCDLFQYYANKNGLNEGILGEYQIVIDSLKDYFDEPKKEMNLKKMFSEWFGSWDYTKAFFGFIITVIGLWYFGKSIPAFVESNYMVDISIGLSIYFVGISLIVNALFTQKSSFEKIQNQITKLSDLIEKKE